MVITLQVYDVGKGSQTVHLAREHDVARKKARKFVNFMDKIRVKNLCMIFTISSAKGSSLRKCVLQGDLCGKRKSQHGNCKAHFDNFRLLPFLSNNTLRYNIC